VLRMQVVGKVPCTAARMMACEEWKYSETSSKKACLEY